MKHRVFLVGSVILALVSLTFNPTVSMAAEPIRIAVVGPLAGPASDPQGKNLFAGHLLAIEEANKNGGILGRQVEAIQIHEGYTAEEVIGAFKKAISAKPAAIVGGTEAGTCEAAAPFLRDAGIPFIFSYASPPSPSKPGFSRHGFRMAYGQQQFWKIHEGFLRNKGYKSVGMLTADAGFGYASEKELRSFTGFKITDVMFYPWGAASTDNEITKLISKNPDCIILSLYGKQAVVPAIKKVRELGYKGDVLMDIDCLNESLVADLPSLFEGIYGVGAWIEDRSDKVAREFSDQVRANTDRIPGSQVALTYTAMKGVLKAIEFAGTADDPDKIADAMFKINWKTPMYGDWFFFPGGQFYIATGFVRQVINGKLEIDFKATIPMNAYNRPYDWYGLYKKQQ